jgi:hypothetical protein
VEGYSSGIPAGLAMLPWPSGTLSLRALSFATTDQLPWDLLGLLNVKYAVLATRDWYTNAGGRADALAAEVELIANPRPVVPRVFFTESVTPVRGASGALAALLPPSAAGRVEDVTRRSVVEGYDGAVRFTAAGDARLSTGADRMRIELTPAPGPRFLVVNERYHPDWRAEVDGRPARIYPTNLVMRGMVVPVGAQSVTLTFEPFVRPVTAAAFAAGALATLAALARLFCAAARTAPRQL